MQNISIKGVCDCVDLDRNIKLTNGAVVVQKEKQQCNRCLFSDFVQRQ